VLLANGALRGDPIYRPVFSSGREPYTIRASEAGTDCANSGRGAEKTIAFNMRAKQRAIILSIARRLGCWQSTVLAAYSCAALPGFILSTSSEVEACASEKPDVLTTPQPAASSTLTLQLKLPASDVWATS
jgi:hypothetical protein